MNFKKLLLAVTLGLSAASSYAAPGDLDTSFAGDGKAGTSIGSQRDAALAVVQQADGKLMAAGYTSNDSSVYNFLLLRYNVNGTLDSSFDGDGKLTTVIGSDQSLSAVIQQHDGKWVAVSTSASHIMLARFNSDGSLDTGFDGDGKLTTTVGIYDYGFSVVQQADNKLVVAGSSCISSNQNGCTAWDFTLVRYNTDGSLDNDFDGDGRLTTNMGAIDDAAYSVIQQTDGKLVVAGTAGSNIILARYNLDGSLDTNFSADGMLTVVDSNYGEIVVIQQMDGRLVVAHGGGSTGNISLMRFTTDGAFDTTFDSDGLQAVAFGSSSTDMIVYACNGVCIRFVKKSLSLVQQADTQLVVAATGAELFALARFHADGSRDSSFVTNRPPPVPPVIGYPDPPILGYPEKAFSLIQQSDGQLVAAGHSGDYGNDVVIARYFSGQADTDADGIFDELDADDDADGILDANDNCSLIINADQQNTDADTQGNACDSDDDNDGVADSNDAFPLDATESADADYDGVGNSADLDDDNDGVPDLLDAFPLNAAESADADLDGVGNNADQDDDNDSVLDLSDKFPFNAAAAVDTDNDGSPNNWNPACNVTCQNNSGLRLDNCSSISNVDQLNADGDSMGDACDADDDNDGVADVSDLFPFDPTRAGDLDGDGFDSLIDNCQTISNVDQLNSDGDYDGNVCDYDDDNDGVLDPLDKFPLNAAASSDIDADGFPGSWSVTCNVTCQSNSGLILDNCPTQANTDQLNTDGDSQGNACDSDDDNDGVADTSDKFPLNAAASSDTDADGFPGSWNAACNVTCLANSGLILDNCPTTANVTQLNFDGDAQGDACDVDDDNDGMPDTWDAFPFDATESGDYDGDGVGDNADTDDDNDGVSDELDAFPYDESESIDSDADGIGNNADTDDDNDGIPDAFDPVPFDPDPVLPLNGVYKGSSISEG
jgi:uncharacterized delta-60 repeat protein